MGGAHGNVHEVALGEGDRAVIHVDDRIALLHVEPLIRFLMDVRRRPTADRDIHDQGRIAAGRKGWPQRSPWWERRRMRDSNPRGR